MNRHVVPKLILLTLAGVLLIAPATGFGATLISGLSPYPDGGDPGDPAAVSACNGAPQLGRVYRNSETEPYLAVNPTNPANIIAGWHQDRWSNGGAQGDLTAYSLDGGATWTPVSIPFSRCAGGAPGSTGDFERASDPWISFGPDGAAYYMALVFNRSSAENGMAVAKSTDGGVTWSEPVVIKQTNAQGAKARAAVHDKNSLTADPFNPDLVYATWTIFRNNKTTIVVARSKDGGLTWGPARPVNGFEVVDPPAQARFRQGVQIVVLPDGTLMNAFFRSIVDPRGGGATVAVEQAIFRSTDQGQHWERLDTTIAQFLPSGGLDVELGIFVRDAGGLPDIAVDQNSGTLYVVWQDGRLSPFGASNILLSLSADGGSTWQGPIPITDSPTNQAFLPAVAVADNGTIGVLYYDFRNDVFGDAELSTDVWLLTANPDGTGVQEERLTGTSFDMRQMVIAGGYFPGDYVGLDTAGNDFVAAYTVANNLGLPVDIPNNAELSVDNNNRQDIMFQRIAR
ncbi:MAG: glycoside hydrolase [Gammaproteobacteria bacterium]|nr:glycoside hydrolase [Gammaproteobacteria bacterium]MDH3374304.1 glycoside hydrolase [Gammaproteobacteria bacterium]MDH3408733.1 glycoside hydrolase [Gammaproteobacteria bacterium]